jgi:hypothetical protein
VRCSNKTDRQTDRRKAVTAPWLCSFNTLKSRGRFRGCCAHDTWACQQHYSGMLYHRQESVWRSLWSANQVQLCL